jgi:hypothetical protein
MSTRSGNEPELSLDEHVSNVIELRGSL